MLRRIARGLLRKKKSSGHVSVPKPAPVQRALSQQLLLAGRIAAFEVQRKERIGTLADVEFRVASQWGEDGIIEWLCHVLPELPRRFVEFGVENYGEANTRFLVENRGWSGLVIDGSASYMEALRRDPIYWRHDLVAVSAFVTAENINELIASAGFAGEIGILSVDIDGNDYWVLKAINNVEPAIIISEINGILGDRHALTIPYQPDFSRLSAHYSGLYFGASVRAISSLCEAKGYKFVGTNSNGVNAFFVRNDLAGRVLDRLAESLAWPPRHRDSRNEAGELTHLRGLARIEAIKDLPVVDVATGSSAPLSKFFPLYSDRWTRQL